MRLVLKMAAILPPTSRSGKPTILQCALMQIGCVYYFYSGKDARLLYGHIGKLAITCTRGLSTHCPCWRTKYVLLTLGSHGELKKEDR